MKIAYFGGDMFYPCMESILKNGHEIIALFTNKQNPQVYNETHHVYQQAKLLGIPIYYSKPTDKSLRDLKKNNCDLILSAGYAYKVPKWEETGIKYAVNVHLSLLPIGAGPAPLPYVIVKGHKRTGCTLHKISQEWDAGDVLLQKSLPLFGNENLEDLFCNSQKMAVNLVDHFLNSPDTYWKNGTPQSMDDREYWPMPGALDFKANFADDLETIDRCLRAHRFVDINGNIEFISNVSTWEKKHKYYPGEIISEKNGVHLVASSSGKVFFKLNKIKPYKYNYFF